LTTKKPGLKKYLSLENMLLTGIVDKDLCDTYPELANTSLEVQLPMFHNSYTFTTVAEAQLLFQKMVPEVRKLFPAVEILIPLLLICPVSSSCAAERSFSALRRLKNWLRTTTGWAKLSDTTLHFCL